MAPLCFDLWEILLRLCCGNFKPKDLYQLKPKEYNERLLESGFCPRCGAWIVTLYKRDFNDVWTVETAKNKKAARLFDKLKQDIVDDLILKIKIGNHSNMGFKFGKNIEIRLKNNGIEIRQYSVDFNGTTELVKVI